MRSIALQNVRWKWLATTVLVVIEVALPPTQQGFLKGGQMMHQIIHPKGPPGPWYWLVASGTPGLARRLPSYTAGAWGWCPTTALAGAMPCLCVRIARGWSGVGLVPSCALRSMLCSCVLRGFRGGCGGLSWPDFLCAPFLVRHSMLSARSAVRVRSPFHFAPPPLCVLVHTHSRVAGALAVLLRLPPPPSSLCAHCARSPCRVLLGPFHVVRAPSRFLFGFLLRGSCGGGGHSSPRSP